MSKDAPARRYGERDEALLAPAVALGMVLLVGFDNPTVARVVVLSTIRWRLSVK